MSRRTLWDAVRDALGRRKAQSDDKPRTRISVARFERPREVVHPERDLSEWVRPKLEHPGISEWDAIVKGKYKDGGK